MTGPGPSAPPAAAGLPVVRLSAGEVVHLDVEFCDLVPARRGDTEESIRFKGRRVDATGRGGELVRVFVDAAGAAVAMQKSGVLRGDLPALPAGEGVVPLPLVHKRLTLQRVESRRGGWTSLDIRPREGAIAAEDETLLADYQWALAHARNQFAPQLCSDGYPVGAAELLSMADALMTARRRARHTRG